MIKKGTQFTIKDHIGLYTISKINNVSCKIEWGNSIKKRSTSYFIQTVEKNFKSGVWIIDLKKERKEKLKVIEYGININKSL